MARTIKFLCAISVSKHILSSEWLEECGNKRQLVGMWKPGSDLVRHDIIVLLIGEAPYVLCDKDTEEMFAMNLSLSLERASQRKLLNGIAIHSTRNVVPNFENLKLIVECAGGKVSIWLARERHFEQFVNIKHDINFKLGYIFLCFVNSCANQSKQLLIFITQLLT